MEIVMLLTIRNTATQNSICTWLRGSLLAIKNTIKLNTFKIQETDLKYITHHTTYKIELLFTAFVTIQFTSLIIGNISERENKNMDKLSHIW